MRGTAEPFRHPSPESSTDRACAIDAAAVVAVGAAICVASQRPVLMSLIVPAVLVLRFQLWLKLPAAVRGHSLLREAAFMTLCVVLGAGNDWNSVVRHGVYDYTVPLLWPRARAIPAWMLLYWGLVLRFVATLSRWERLPPPAFPADDIHLGARVVTSPVLKVAGELVLIVSTRQLIYAYHGHAVLSWLPFAAALAAYAILFRCSRHDRVLLVLAASAGPLIEVVFIQLGRLHVYHLGWLGGVPLWIILWWMLAVLVWNDVSARLLEILGGPALGQAAARPRRSAAGVPPDTRLPIVN